MSEPNQDLIRAYMMRGACTGLAEAEKPPVKYCAGKLDNGRPCRIVRLGDEDYCMRHKKEIEALEAGAPLPIGRVERQEDEEMAKHRCAKKNCTRAVKNEGDMCWQHKGVEDQAEAGSVIIHDANNLDVKPATKTVTSDNVLQNAVHENMDSATSFGVFAVGMGDGTENLSHAPAASTPHQEQLIPSATPRKGLAALIAVVPAPPILPVGMHIPFAPEELAILEEQEVTPEVIRQFVIMGLEQQLRPVVDEEDPLAKSRVRPEGE